MTAPNPVPAELMVRLRDLVEACGRAVRFTRLNPTEVALVATEARKTIERLSSECEDLRKRWDAAERVCEAYDVARKGWLARSPLAAAEHVLHVHDQWRAFRDSAASPSPEGTE